MEKRFYVGKIMQDQVMIRCDDVVDENGVPFDFPVHKTKVSGRLRPNQEGELICDEHGNLSFHPDA